MARRNRPFFLLKTFPFWSFSFIRSPRVDTERFSTRIVLGRKGNSRGIEQSDILAVVNLNPSL